MTLSLTDWKKWYADHAEEIQKDFFTFLRFPTIATDSHYHEPCLSCADWLCAYMKDIGLQTELWKTSGQPVVFGKNCQAGPNRPTLLIYHHYDVQPVDPLELWKSDPFSPEVREGNVFARGAQDNKGQCFYSLSAIRAFLELCESLNFNLKVFIEGEEESGSAGTVEVFTTKAKELKSDYLLIVDAGIPADEVPAITLGMRGIITGELSLRASRDDLHSGSFGGIAYNPLRALCEMLSSLWDETGKVAVDGFYEGVPEFSNEELAKLDLEVDEEKLRKDVGLTCFRPEPGFSLGASGSIRPTMEINGIGGGYTGEGFKTVIPAEARAKISCRLVGNQDPQKIMPKLQEHLEKAAPVGMQVDLKIQQGFTAFSSSPDSLIAKVCAKAYEEVLGKPCLRIFGGGSVPITGQLAEASGAETLGIGYGLDSDLIHAPNEHFALKRFEQGFLTIGRILSLLHEKG